MVSTSVEGSSRCDTWPHAVEMPYIRLHRLVNGGHSVVVIEHDLDVIAEADRVLDLSPEGGNDGGRVVAATAPVNVVKLGTHTGKALEAVLAR